MIRINVITLAALFIFSSCGGRGSKSQDAQTIECDSDSAMFYTLDFERVLLREIADSVSHFVINDIAKDISFIPLESTAQAWPGNMIATMIIGEQNYIIAGMMPGYRINLYELNGELIKDISSAGNGEKELPDWPLGLFSNPNLGNFCVRSTRKILINSLEGEYISNIHLAKEVPSVGEMALLSSGDFVCTPAVYMEMDDNDAPYLFFIDNSGEITSSCLYDEKRDLTQLSMSEMNQDRLRNRERSNLTPNYMGDALFRDQFSDVVYKIESKESITPYLNLHRGDLKPTAADSFDAKKNRKKIYYSAMIESQKYVVVKYMYDLGIYTSIWDKKEERIIANHRIDRDLKQDGLGYKLHTYYKTKQSEEVLVNLVCATQDKLYALIEAEKASEFLPEVGYDSNHVIMVVDLK